MTVIIDTGCANLTSLKFALDRLGVEALITVDPKQIYAAERVFLPGVGSAQYAMQNLSRKDLLTVLPELTQPVLGICLGMQLLMASSTEGETNCLNVIPGKVKTLNARGSRLPHMGWNTLTRMEDSPLFQGIKSEDYLYFVHSYAVNSSRYAIASCEYGSSFSAAICKDNFYGVQFHPERSGAKGLEILKNFLELKS